MGRKQQNPGPPIAGSLIKYFDLIGRKVEDKVTGLKGVVTSLGFDLYGCIQVVINPGLDKDGKQIETRGLDISRLNILSKKPVMEPPDFSGISAISEGKKGPAEKPILHN